MKKNMMKIALMAIMAFAVPTAMNAQLADLLNKAKDAIAGSSSTAGTVTDIVGNLLGSNKITQSNLVGTWSYTQPCIAFETENALNKIGGSVASAKIEEKLKTGLSTAGIKEGQLTLTFKSDKTFSITAGKRTVSGTYEIDGSDVVLNFKSPAKSIKTNAKISLGTLQLAMKADKMLEIVNVIATKASAYSTQMGTVSSLLSNYKGMYLGLKFKKK